MKKNDTPFRATRHLHQRTSQRGLRWEDLEFALAHGRIEGDKYVLGVRDLKAMLEQLDRQRRTIVRMIDKGGIVAVEADGATITAYRPNSVH
jgi:hypothetical protein